MGAEPALEGDDARWQIEWNRRPAWQRFRIGCAAVVMMLTVVFGPFVAVALVTIPPGGEPQPGVRTVIPDDGADPVTDCGGNALGVAFGGAKVKAETVEAARAAEGDCAVAARWWVGVGAVFFILAVASLVRLLGMRRRFHIPKGVIFQ